MRSRVHKGAEERIWRETFIGDTEGAGERCKMRNFTFTVRQVLLGWQIVDREQGGICSTHGGRNIYAMFGLKYMI
jgi:hypothetical protein